MHKYVRVSMYIYLYVYVYVCSTVQNRYNENEKPEKSTNIWLNVREWKKRKGKQLPAFTRHLTTISQVSLSMDRQTNKPMNRSTETVE